MPMTEEAIGSLLRKGLISEREALEAYKMLKSSAGTATSTAPPDPRVIVRRETPEETKLRENWSEQPSGGYREEPNPMTRNRHQVESFIDQGRIPVPTQAQRSDAGWARSIAGDLVRVPYNAGLTLLKMIGGLATDPVGATGDFASMLTTGMWNEAADTVGASGARLPDQSGAQQGFQGTFAVPTAESIQQEPLGPAMAVASAAGMADMAPVIGAARRGAMLPSAREVATKAFDTVMPDPVELMRKSGGPSLVAVSPENVPFAESIARERLASQGASTVTGQKAARGRGQAVGEEIGKWYDWADQGKQTVPASTIYAALDELRNTVGRSEAERNIINRAERDVISRVFGDEAARTYWKDKTSRPEGDIPIGEARQIKTMLQEITAPAFDRAAAPGGAAVAMGKEAQGAAATAIKENIAAQLEQIAAPNMEYGLIQDSLDIIAKDLVKLEAMQVIPGNLLKDMTFAAIPSLLRRVGIGSKFIPIGKAAFDIISRPDISSRLAVNIYNARNKVAGMEGARELTSPTGKRVLTPEEEMRQKVKGALKRPVTEENTSKLELEGPRGEIVEQPTGIPPEGLATKGAGEPGVKRALVRAEEGVNRETGVTLSDAEFERLMMGEERAFPPEEGPPGVPPEGLAAKGAGEPGVGAALKKGQVGSAQRGTGLQTGPSTEPALERHMGDTPRGRLNVPDAGVPPPAPEPPPAIVRKAYKVGNESYSPGDVLSGNDATLKQGLAFKVLDRDKVVGDFPKGGLVVEHKSTGGIFHLTDRQVKQLNKFTESEAGGTPPAPFGRKAPGGRTRPNDWGKSKVEVAKNTSPITVREYPPGPPIPREKALELQGKYRDYVKREYLPKIEESNINPGVVKAFKEENGQVVWDDAAAAKGVAEAGTGIETPNAEGKFMRGAAAKTAPHAAEVLRKNLKDLKLDERWDGATTVEEAFNKGQNTKYLTPEVTSQRIDLRYGPNKKGYHGNKKMAYPSEAYPKGKDTFDLPGCGREAWAVKNGLIEAKGPCYSGGKCYAEVLTRTYQGNSASVSKGIFKRNISKDVRPTLADSIKKYGIEKTRELYPEIEIKEGPDPKNPGKTKITFGTYKTASGDIVKATDASKFEARPSTVSTNLSPADGIDVRLGVDTDGGAWLSDKRVMDALLKSNPRSLAVYTSAYHTPPSPHPLAGRTTINVTVSGSHPMVETMSRLKWAEEARKNGWTVVLREVVANPKQFGDMAAQYNRLHDALLKTDFTMMQQPLHIGKKHSEPMWGMPSCCVGSKKNPQTCDRCEVAEGKGSFFKAFWGIKEGNSPRGQILPDLYQKPPLVRKEK